MDTALPTMNGANVIARWRETVFIRIPRNLQAPVNGGCGCDYCKAHPDQTPMWDTLAVGTKRPSTGNDYTWTVHCPDPKHLWDAEQREAAAKGKKVQSVVA